MKCVKKLFDYFFKFLLGAFGFLVAVSMGIVIWTTFFPGPKAKEFCDSHAEGTIFDRTAVIRELSKFPDSYTARIQFKDGEAIFSKQGVALKVHDEYSNITVEEFLTLPTRENESFKIISLGMRKRSCTVRAVENKIVESQTRTWD